MYIRANGMLLIKSDNEQDNYYHKGIRYELHQDENIVISQTGDIYKIKSQGDNLIDVLEFRDLLLIGGFVYEILCATQPNKFSKITDITAYSKTSNKHIDLSRLIDEDTEYKIITHEQYLPLAQEAK